MAYKNVSFWYCLFVLSGKQVIYLPEYNIEKKLDKFVMSDEIEIMAKVLFLQYAPDIVQPMSVPAMLAKAKRYIRMNGGSESDFISYELLNLIKEV